MRQIFWGSGATCPDDIESAVGRVTLDLMELAPGEKASMSLTLREGLRHRLRSGYARHDVSRRLRASETQERRTLSLVFAESHAHSGTMTLQPGPARITFENKAARRTLPGLVGPRRRSSNALSERGGRS